MILGKQIDTTKGDLPKLIWQLAWPIIIVNLIQVVYNMADTFWVGQLDYSKQAIAAVTTSYTVVFVMVSLAIGLTIATTTLVSMYFGANDKEKLDQSCFTSIILISLIGVFLSTIGLLFGEPLLRLINTPADVFEYAIEYYRIIMIGIIFMFGFFVLSAILRGVGDTITPMIAGIVSGIINIVLDPFLIFGWGPFPELGVAGAAYATIFARGLVFLYLVYFIFSGKKHFTLSIKDIKLNWEILKKLIKIGIPASISQVLLSLGGSLLISRVNMFGTISSSAFGLVERVNSLIFLPAMSVSQAVATVVGQNIGANQKDRALKSGKLAIVYALIVAALISIVLFIFPSFLFNLMFSKAGEDVINLASNALQYLCFGFVFLTIRVVINGIFQGSGATNYLMVMTFISLVLRISLAYILSYTTIGVLGIFIGISLSFILSGSIMYIVFKRGKWLNLSIIESNQ